jgi:predicted RNase H-like HicB family nuclease
MQNKYTIILSWSEQDDAYLAEVPELPGCMADGRTYQEALNNAERTIEEWIETAEKLGRPIPEFKARRGHRQLGGGIGKLTIVEDDESHLKDFKEYMP